jgi:hypothetical protein
MEIFMVTVYWGVPEKAAIRAQDPVYVLKDQSTKKDLKNLDWSRCPAVRKYFKNTYALKSYYTYTLDKVQGGIGSSDFDQNFYDNHVRVRNDSERFYSFVMPYMLFTEEDSLDVSLIPALLEDTDAANSTIVIPGTMDIAKTFRPLECAFHLKEGVDRVNFVEGEIFQYIQIHTNEKVNFKRFRWTPALDDYMYTVLGAPINRENKYKPLSYYYNLFKNYGLGKKILEEIRSNLCN